MMLPELVKRTRQNVDADDLACQFMEDEVGRHDWRNNWPAVKARGNVRERIVEWLGRLNLEGDPDEIIAYLDRMVAERAGSWR
jgi:hypothetical protein